MFMHRHLFDTYQVAMLERKNELWNEISRWRREGVRMGHQLHLHQEPPYFGFSMSPERYVGIRPLAIFGDSVTAAISTLQVQLSQLFGRYRWRSIR